MRQEKLLNQQWRDMEVVNCLQGLENIFVGGAPGTAEEYLKKICLSMGYSATAFAKNRRKGPLEGCKKEPKGLVELAPVAQMFKDRYYHGSGREKILASSS